MKPQEQRVKDAADAAKARSSWVAGACVPASTWEKYARHVLDAAEQQRSDPMTPPEQSYICPECGLATDGQPCPFTRCPKRKPDREPPKWPTDESLDALQNDAAWNERDRDDLRRAMLADPIIQAAIRLRSAYPAVGGPRGTGSIDFNNARDDLIAAVNEAGL